VDKVDAASNMTVRASGMTHSTTRTFENVYN